MTTFHLVRAGFWIAMVPVIFLLGVQDSVVVVFLYSTYANFASDLGAYEGAKAKEEARS
jgi:hypothetical protein